MCVIAWTSSLHYMAGDEAAALGEDEQLLHAAAEELLLPQASYESEPELDGQVLTRPHQMVAVLILTNASCTRTRRLALPREPIRAAQGRETPTAETTRMMACHTLQEEVEEEAAGAAAAEAAATRTRGGPGGARADGGRRRARRADQRGVAEPLVRGGGPAGSRALGLVDVPDANHEVAHLILRSASTQPVNHVVRSLFSIVNGHGRSPQIRTCGTATVAVRKLQIFSVCKSTC